MELLFNISLPVEIVEKISFHVCIDTISAFSRVNRLISFICHSRRFWTKYIGNEQNIWRELIIRTAKERDLHMLTLMWWNASSFGIIRENKVLYPAFEESIGRKPHRNKVTNWLYNRIVMWRRTVGFSSWNIYDKINKILLIEAIKKGNRCRFKALSEKKSNRSKLEKLLLKYSPNVDFLLFYYPECSSNENNIVLALRSGNFLIGEYLIKRYKSSGVEVPPAILLTVIESRNEHSFEFLELHHPNISQHMQNYSVQIRNRTSLLKYLQFNLSVETLFVPLLISWKALTCNPEEYIFLIKKYVNGPYLCHLEEDALVYQSLIDTFTSYGEDYLKIIFEKAFSNRLDVESDKKVLQDT